MKIGYTYSNFRIFNAHVLAEDSSKLFRITLKVVQVLEFNNFRNINRNKPKQARQSYTTTSMLSSNLTHKNWSFTSV